MGNTDDLKATNKWESDLPVCESGNQTQPSEPSGSAQLTHGMGDIPTVPCAKGSNLAVLKKAAGVKKTGMSIMAPYWAKDGGDKFYSLTEESDFTSSEHNQSDTGSSIFSETRSVSSTNESTVRQQQRDRKCVKERLGPREGIELSALSSSKTLQWDYAGIKLMEAPATDGQPIVDRSIERNTCDPANSTCTTSSESGMLQSIYDSIKELQTETRVENRCARVATKCLQGTVRRVAKTCVEIEVKLNAMEERTMAVEADVEALKGTVCVRGWTAD
ncbi:hypothetical protein NDU88_003674 [Pleurodeles waltl]|uniref:Uncharacterized protein n=1 Tax=Pleurodeles waltl TaxID=8319 RepID=A0AAV7LJ91_PLEWA|nr:hypothetical protein NDU88_003674 [Pleurodeles waltl]